KAAAMIQGDCALIGTLIGTTMPAAMRIARRVTNNVRRRPASSMEEDRSSKTSDCDSQRNLPDCAINCATAPAMEAYKTTAGDCGSSMWTKAGPRNNAVAKNSATV